ncbi:MAG: XRE family transcriptional regulator [Bifidobacteriaceae bacterium]|jgi:DNA-directed RNA polymerase specialized sigma24 family protein|nr:XRE family transcriptional regulator [Bifidobacteriaceae bacterium]
MELVAECHRFDGWWIVDVPAVRGLHTQVRRLDQVEAMVKDAASLLLDRPEADFTVVVLPKLPKAEQRKIDETKAARVRLSEAENAMAKASRAAVTDLRAEGLTVRDVATLIGVTPSRVSQLA